MLKRFLVFDYSDYYPGGGWNDFEGTFDTIEEALRAHPECREIVDTTTAQVVHERDYYGEIIKSVQGTS